MDKVESFFPGQRLRVCQITREPDDIARILTKKYQGRVGKVGCSGATGMPPMVSLDFEDGDIMAFYLEEVEPVV